MSTSCKLQFSTVLSVTRKMIYNSQQYRQIVFCIATLLVPGPVQVSLVVLVMELMLSKHHSVVKVLILAGRKTTSKVFNGLQKGQSEIEMLNSHLWKSVHLWNCCRW